MIKALALILLTMPLMLHAAMRTTEGLCFDQLPGELGSPYDTEGKVRLQELTISQKGEKAFVATEYLGSTNLQASVFLVKTHRYCLSGELGAATDVQANPKRRVNGRYEIVTLSKSGSDHFYRYFHFAAGQYVLVNCKIKTERGITKRCSQRDLQG